MTTYRVQALNGRYDHVVGKRAALDLARRMADAPNATSEAELTREWGITIKRVTASVAASVGLR